MTAICRAWWRNCALTPDKEILAIDDIEDRIAPLTEDASKVRILISTLELCHHKSQRWIHNIIRAIGGEEPTKGLGTRTGTPIHPRERIWQSACAAISAWCAGTPSRSINLLIDTVQASQLLAGLGERSALKEWQAQRVIEKIRSTINWPRVCNDPTAQYVFLLLNAGEYESDYVTTCPEHYKEHKSFWLNTVQTIIHDTVNGTEADLSLGLAIDMLWPCHWRFVENLQVVLDAIGGKHTPESPFAACGRNITLLPIRHRLTVVSSTLQTYCGKPLERQEIDRHLLEWLGEPTEQKTWLAASLDKTIRLQLDPPEDVRRASALSGPEWIKQQDSV